MMALRLALLSALLSVATGFLVAPLAARRAPMRVNMGVEDVAAACLEEECSVDTVFDLVAELKRESTALKKRGESNAQVLTLMRQLEALNADPEANKGEIEKLVIAASRSFSVVDGFSFPGEPLGYTGKVGTTTTAGASFDK